jgi:hypothetical protein
MHAHQEKHARLIMGCFLYRRRCQSSVWRRRGRTTSPARLREDASQDAASTLGRPGSAANASSRYGRHRTPPMDCIYLIIASETTEIHHLSMKKTSLVNIRKQTIVLKRQLIGKTSISLWFSSWKSQEKGALQPRPTGSWLLKPSPDRCDTQVGTERGNVNNTTIWASACAIALSFLLILKFSQPSKKGHQEGWCPQARLAPAAWPASLKTF